MARDEVSLLQAFDANRAAIYAAATKAVKRGKGFLRAHGAGFLIARAAITRFMGAEIAAVENPELLLRVKGISGTRITRPSVRWRGQSPQASANSLDRAKI